MNCGFPISVINVCFHVVFIMRLVQSERSRVLTMIIQNVTLARARAAWRTHARGARARPKNMCALARAARARDISSAQRARATKKCARHPSANNQGVWDFDLRSVWNFDIFHVFLAILSPEAKSKTMHKTAILDVFWKKYSKKILVFGFKTAPNSSIL